MQLFSEVTNKVYDVVTYQMKEKLKGISHDSLQDILENQLSEENVTYEVNVLASSETYAAVECIIHDASRNRTIKRFNDISINNVSSREEVQQNFAKEHPLIAAANSAIDNAVKAYLKFPKVIVEDAEEPTVPEESIPEEPSEDISSNSTEFTGMNPPEEDEEEEVDVLTRIKELGSKKAPSSSKYKNMTYDEIYEKNPGWFNYVKDKNRSDTYKDAREYINLKKIVEGNLKEE